MWDASKFLEDKLTALTEQEAAYALREAYKRVIGDYPSRESLSILIAQTALETGRWKKMHNGNWGNIKSKPNDGHYWTMFECGEIINGRQEFFKPPHDQCKFRAYLTPTDGAEDYIKFLTGNRYAKALVHLKAGRVTDYTTALKNAGYFTANLNKYLTDMKKLFNEFMGKMESLYYWKPLPSVTPLPVTTNAPEPKSVILPPPLPEPAPAPVPTSTSTETKTDSEVDPKQFKKSGTKSIAILGAVAVLYAIVASLLQYC